MTFSARRFRPRRGGPRSAAGPLLAAGLAALVLGISGCAGGSDSPVPAGPSESERVSAGPSRREAPGDTAGPPGQAAWVSLQGQVVWSGPMPAIADCMAIRTTGAGGVALQAVPHPNRLQREPVHGGVAEAFVWLEPVSPRRDGETTPAASRQEEGAAPEPGAAAHWPPLHVRLHNQALFIEQGKRSGRLGIAAAGAEITITGEGEAFYALAGRGAAFFRWAVPAGCSPLVRRLPPLRREVGPSRAVDDAVPADSPASPWPIIELFDDARRYWTRAYILVCNHPYAAITDAQGRFHWPAVPPGEWELVVWHPSWTVRRQERDPESTLVVRQFFTAPLVRRRTLKLAPTSEAAPPAPLVIDLSAPESR